jgi:hypothetical protein
MRNFGAESEFTGSPVLSMGGVTVWTKRERQAEVPSRPQSLVRISSCAVDIAEGTQILVNEQDGESWYGLFLSLSHHRKIQERKLVLHKIGDPWGTKVMVKPNGTRQCFIAVA